MLSVHGGVSYRFLLGWCFYCLLCFQVNNIGELLESNLILLLQAVVSLRP